VGVALVVGQHCSAVLCGGTKTNRTGRRPPAYRRSSNATVVADWIQASGFSAS
jgi:hypothetical protein